MEWATTSMDETGSLIMRMNTPRTIIDNALSPTDTLIMVDSGWKHGTLLEVVEILGNLSFSINKGYISSNGGSFRDVFHVTDQDGNKLTEKAIKSIEESIGTGLNSQRSNSFCGVTALEVTGTNRPGLLSDVFAILTTDLRCNIVEAKVWTHNGRVASLIYITNVDDSGDSLIMADSEKGRLIEARLRDVLGDSSRIAVSTSTATHAERRLHQMMFADRDYERSASSRAAAVVVEDWWERGYTVVKVDCKDRPKLLFDVLCTFGDMDYVVFHGTIETRGSWAHQEFYIRHVDGTPISSEAERQCLVQCLQAAIERRTSPGVRVELCTGDRQGLLADLTQSFEENGLSVAQADVSTSDQIAKNVFYLTPHAAEHPVKAETIEAIRQRVGLSNLQVKEPGPVFPAVASFARAAARSASSLKKLFRRNTISNMGPISSSS